jgi:phage pi2 protein 07
MKTYKLTKEEYNELQELLFWWKIKKLKKQKKVNKRIKTGKGLKPIPYDLRIEPKEYDFWGYPKN